MAKRTIRITNKGIIDDGPLDGKAESTSVELKLMCSKVESVLTVGLNTTGTVGNHTMVLASAPSVVTLPSAPVHGQSIRILSAGSSAFGVSASHDINAQSGVRAMNLSASAGSTGVDRLITFLSSSSGNNWVSLAQTGAAGTSGSFTFT